MNDVREYSRSARLPLEKRPEFAVAAFATVVALLMVLVQKAEYIWSPFLIADDQDYVVNYILFDAPANLLSFKYLKFIVNSFGLSGARLFLVISTVVSAGALSAYIYYKTRNFLSSFAPILALAIPVSSSQFLFINGSHPTSAIPAVVGFFLCMLGTASARSPLKAIANFFVAACSAVLAFLLTPLAPALSLSALIAIPIAVLYKKAQLLNAFFLTVLAAVSPIAFIYRNETTSRGRNHYLDYDGWVDFSVYRVFERLGESVATLATSPGVVAATIFAASIPIILIFYNLRKGSLKLKKVDFWVACLSATLIAGAALCFAPALVVPNPESRYFEVPTFLFVTGTLLISLQLLPGLKLPRWSWLLPIPIACALGWLGNTEVDRDVGRLQTITDRVAAQLNSYDGGFSENAQIVIVGDRLPFSGFNHWSSGLFRYLLNRPDIIGLIGPTSGIGPHDPFVERWQSHAPEYHAVGPDGIRYRIRMIGLERNRPTYAFHYDGSRGLLVPARITASSQGRLLTAPIGEPFREVEPTDADRSASQWSETCQSDSASEESNNTIHLGAPMSSSAPAPSDLEIALSLNGDERPSINLMLPAQVTRSIQMVLVPDTGELERQNFSDEYPPTPILARGWFQAWQLETELWVLQSEAGNLRYRGSTLPLRIDRAPGCGMRIQFGDSKLVIPEPDDAREILQIGRGYHDRVWRGDFHYTIVD